jgi:hypothetical protein
MNPTADLRRKDNDPGEKKRRGFLQRRMSRPFLVLGGIAIILLAGFVFYPYRNAPLSLWSDLKTGPNVFRTKIPEEIKMAQNIFRGKIAAVDQALNPPVKIPGIAPVEKKAVSSQPTDAAHEKSEALQQPALVEPVESQTKVETTPPVAEAVLSEPTTAPPEQIEPLGEAPSSQPVESPIIIETPPPVAKAVPSQPTDTPSEKSEVLPETEPHLPAEPQTKIETNLPAEEQPVYSQPTLAPPEPEVLPQKADLHQAEERPQPVEEDASGKTEERIIHREEWLLSQTSSYYTIQLMGVRKEALLFDFVKRNQLLKQDEIAFYQTTFKDKPWFQLLYGVYATKKDAQSAADNLPPKIRESSPWIRRLSGVQKAIRKKAAP